MDGGCQEKHTNMQEGGFKGGNLTHILHERTHFDHSSDLRTPATTTSQQLNSDQQQAQAGARTQINVENNKEKQQRMARTAGQQEKGTMTEDMGAKDSTSNQGNTPKSKNKPRKKNREAAKNRQQVSDQQGEQQENGETCKKFIMVDEHLGMDITSLQTQYMNPLLNVPPDKMPEKCQMNKGPTIDEYVVDNSEDEVDVDNQSLNGPDEDDETSDLLIRAFSPHPDKGLAEEIQQVANNQGISPEDFIITGSNSKSKISTLSQLADQTLDCSLPDHLND
ncbi:hypothetical protein H5410_003060 [Solanum commersonii]|uniref:Uncharacterized protein n=1 Tax=Solanum commersonii TaxID=4109 RepID=A0A9J6B4N1_SOLCO|nr:hypothetical protein H5410_003060 [Solanum commersonii]